MPANTSTDVLVPESELRNRDVAIRAATEVAVARLGRAAEDAGEAPAFRYYLVFENGASALSVGFAELDAPTLFYNRYYWFKRFVKQHEARYGFDAGLEQQAFKLLESAPEDIDWAVIGHLDARVLDG
jgi:hypothetical protein